MRPIEVMASVTAEMLFLLVRTMNQVISPRQMMTDPERPRYLGNDLCQYAEPDFEKEEKPYLPR